MTRESIYIDSFTHLNPIPAATRIGPLIESGIIPPFNDGVRELPDTLEAMVDNLFLHMGNMLSAAGADWSHVAKITFFADDPAAAKNAVNDQWVVRFPDPDSRPSRHTLKIDTGGKMMIRCVFTAFVPS